MLHSAGQDIGKMVLERVCGVFPRPVFDKNREIRDGKRAGPLRKG